MLTERLAPPDVDQRRTAAGELDKNLVVLAGAGTGKTTLLIDRLTLLIVGKEIPIEKIVALTFTKKAAEEMRVRLEERLNDIVNGKASVDLLEERFSANRNKWPVLAKKALEDIPKSQLGTIHSFAGHLLRLYPLQAGVDPKFREDQGMIGETVFESLWTEWIARELSKDSKHAKEWTSLLQRVVLSELRELAWVLVGPMVDLDSLPKSPDLSVFFKQATDTLIALHRKYSLPARAPAFLPALDALDTVLTLLRERKQVPEDLLDLLDSLDKPPKDWAEAKDALKELKKSVLAFARVDEKLFKEIFALLLPFVKTVRGELARRGAVSFDGLLVFARNLLRDHTEVRSALKKRFKAFLIDEFQDTDPLQGEILFYLAERLESNALRWQDVRLEAGRLFVVGDPKQSIYRFRGADIAAFEAFEEEMVKQGALRATLSANFRSDPRILDFVNTIFPPAMKEEPYIQPPYSPLEPGLSQENLDPGQRHSGVTAAVRVLRIQGENSTKLSAESRRIVEAQTIAQWIRSQVKTGLRYSDVALLLRSANAFEEYLEAFRRRGIPYLAEGEKSFYRTTEALDFLNLLSVVADPQDSLALVGILRSPVGGLTDKEIWELKTADGLSIHKKPHVHREKIGRLFAELDELSKEALVKPLGALIQSVFRRTWALETTSTSPHGEQAVANLLKIGRLAEEWSVEESLTLKEFVRRFERYRDDERDEGENPLADVKYDAVKVLTIHKAKGLEFPVVLLPNLSAGTRGGGDKKPVRRDWSTGLAGLRLGKRKSTNAAMALIEQEEEKREKAEEVRVFYVAATRAKSQMVCFVEASAKGRFAEIVTGLGEIPSVVYEDIQESTVTEEKAPKPAFEPGAAWNVEKLAPFFKARDAEFVSMRGKRRLMSPTSLMAEAEKHPLIDDEEAPAPREQAILIGHMCHKVLEEWDFTLVASKQKAALKKLLERAAKLYELPATRPDAGAIKEECHQILAGFLASEVYKKLSKAKILGRELPFISLNMRGVIDLLYEDAGRIVIADYKTNKVEKGSTKTLVEHYRPQAEAYRKAVEAALGKKVSVELLFLREAESLLVQ